MQGVRLADIADLMGHKDLATTQIYAKVQIDHLRGALEQLGPLVVSGKDEPAESRLGESSRSSPSSSIRQGDKDAEPLFWRKLLPGG